MRVECHLTRLHGYYREILEDLASLQNDYEKQSEALRVCQTQAPKIRQGVEELDKDVKCLCDLREILGEMRSSGGSVKSYYDDVLERRVYLLPSLFPASPSRISFISALD